MRTTALSSLSSLVGAALITFGAAASAADYRFELLDLGRFETSHSEFPGQKFRGSGYLGMLDYRWSDLGFTWSHALDLSPAADGRTLMQLNLAPLAGQRIVSATLSFRLLHGQDAPGESDIQVTGFRSDGRLRLQWEAPNPHLGMVTGRVGNQTTEPQAIDITPLVASAVQQGQRWLGLHLQSLGEAYLYTATHDYPNLLYPDRAEVRISVITESDAR